MTAWITVAILTIACIIIYVEYRKYNRLCKVTSPNRGTRSEHKLIYLLLNYGTPEPTIFHDLYLQTSHTRFSQIDLVVPTKVGLIVIEVKEYSGWIFGTGNQPQWTQVLNYGQEKHRFYNPILQNNRHIDHIKKKLPKENVPYFSIIVFYGDCELKDITYIPKNTYLTKPHMALIAFEKIQRENPPANYTDKHNILRVLKQAVTNGANPTIQQQHIQNIRDHLGKDRILQ